MNTESNTANSLMAEKPSVLVVDDEKDLASALTDWLKEAGYTASFVTSFPDAVAALQAMKQGALLTDLRLGSYQDGGLELAQAAQKKGIPTILMTAYGDYGVAKKALNTGVSHFLEKPFAFEDVAKALEFSSKSMVQRLAARVDHFVESLELTKREAEVFRLMLKGLSSREISAVLGNSEKTTKTHLTSIFKKAKVGSRAELFSLVFPT